jgi:hypothetical protein
VDAAEGPLSANSLIIDHLMMEQLTTLVVARLTNVFQLSNALEGAGKPDFFERVNEQNLLESVK